MTRDSQKDHERLILEEYLRVRGLSADESEPREPPDFALKFGDEHVAVEVLEYFEPNVSGFGFSKKQVEETWEALKAYVRDFRETNNSLEGLSVSLEFKSYRLPAKRELPQFVSGIITQIESNREVIDDDFRYLNVDAGRSFIGEYIKNICVRDVGIYMEWDWNFSIGSVGANEYDLLAATERKLVEYQRRSEFSEHHLVIAGWGGPGLSNIIAPLSAEQFNNYATLNERLKFGPFDVAAILCLKNLIWEKGRGWCELRKVK